MSHLHFKALQIISHTQGFLKISVGIQISLKIPILKAVQRYLIIALLLHETADVPAQFVLTLSA